MITKDLPENFTDYQCLSKTTVTTTTNSLAFVRDLRNTSSIVETELIVLFQEPPAKTLLE